GRGGGYLLVRSPARLTILEVIEASEGDTRLARCVLRGVACRTTDVCEVHAVLDEAQRALRDRLSLATLAHWLENESRDQADLFPATRTKRGRRSADL